MCVCVCVCDNTSVWHRREEGVSACTCVYVGLDAWLGSKCLFLYLYKRAREGQICLHCVSMSVRNKRHIREQINSLGTF